MAAELSDEELSILSTDLGHYAETIASSPGETIAPSQASFDSREERALARLTRESLRPATQAAMGVELLGPLGEGGMAVVMDAVQLSLERRVAVKMLNEQTRESQRSRLKLLREAWVTGAVEHPSVVPIHDIIVDEAGNPLVVLKRVDGRTWSEVIEDQELAAREYDAADLLRFNIEVLIQVCHAVRYAHEQRIVHRDLKPDNVMLGRFGEVYVLDWGIALSLRKREDARTESPTIAGTPHYMAPEMLTGDESRIDERTDVYLLGATLFQILTRRPPHQAESFLGLIKSIREREPEVPQTTPEALRKICLKAMARDPADRYANVGELQDELRAYLRLREADQIIEEADERRAVLVELLTAPLEDRDHEQAYRLLAECRFGYGAASRVAPESEAAETGLRVSLEAVARHELDRGAPQAASVLLSQVDNPDPDLVRAVADARSAQEQEAARQAALERDRSIEIGARTRTILGAGVIGGFWVIAPLVLRTVHQTPQYESILGTLVGFWIISVVAAVVRRDVFATIMNRSAFRLLLSTVSLIIVFTALGWHTGMNVELVPPIAMLMGALGAAAAASTVQPALAAASVAYLGAALVSWLAPEWNYLGISIANLVVAATFLLIGRQVRAGTQHRGL